MAAMDKAWTLGIGQLRDWWVGTWDDDRPAGDQPGMAQLFRLNERWPYPLMPSEYVQRQIHVSFQDDPVAIACRHVTGVSTLVWGADYPHAEGTFMHSHEAIEHQFRGVGPRGSQGDRRRHARRVARGRGADPGMKRPPGHQGSSNVSVTNQSDVYYDPYDLEIDADPYPVYRRLRDEAPLYYNERHDFFAVSRADDVERVLPTTRPSSPVAGRSWTSSAPTSRCPRHVHLRGPAHPHEASQGGARRVHPTTGGRARAADPRVHRPKPRPIVGSGRFDFIADLGAQLPMRDDRHAARHPRVGPGGHP